MKYTSYKDYLVYLLPSAFKKIKFGVNSWVVLMQYIGSLADKLLKTLLWVFKQGTVMGCDDSLLLEHGLERNMPRLKGETNHSYRKRLAQKYDIAIKAGTNEGIKSAVKALGYDNSYVEPFYLIDPQRYAEFIIWLRTSNESGISLNNIAVIDSEVMKIKPAGEMPNYGIESSSFITITTNENYGTIFEPKCGTFLCGQYPNRGSDFY